MSCAVVNDNRTKSPVAQCSYCFDAMIGHQERHPVCSSSPEGPLV